MKDRYLLYSCASEQMLCIPNNGGTHYWNRIYHCMWTSNDYLLSTYDRDCLAKLHHRVDINNPYPYTELVANLDEQIDWDDVIFVPAEYERIKVMRVDFIHAINMKNLI